MSAEVRTATVSVCLFVSVSLCLRVRVCAWLAGGVVGWIDGWMAGCRLSGGVTLQSPVR